MKTINWEDFVRVDIRVGRIVSAEVFAAARKPAYVLRVDFGPEIGERTSSAQITGRYRPEELVGRLVVGVVNLPEQRIGPLCSGCLITGFPDDNGEVVLCVPDKPVQPGSRLF